MFENSVEQNIDVCRACLSTKCAKMESLFSNDLLDKYIECTSLQVTKKDLLPHKLCAKCAQIVLSWFHFKEQCRASEITFLECISKAKIFDEVNIKKESPITLTIDLVSKTETKEENEDEDNRSLSDNCFEKDFIFDDSDEDKLINKTVQKKSMERNGNLKDNPVNEKRVLRSIAGVCELCKKVFSYKRSLESHLEICGKDGKRIRKYDAKAEEKRLLPKSDALLCGICHMVMNNHTQLKKHLEDHRVTNILLCQICNLEAIDFADLVSHRYAHQKQGFRLRIQCHLCSRRFGKLDRLEFHFRGVHMGKKPGLCKVCGKTFLDIKHWKYHKVTHTGVKIECHICHKTFAYQYSLHNHMKCHSDVRQFICHLCGFTCKIAAGLKSHHFRIHTNSQPMPCDHCDKTFKNKETLREHLLRVKGERNFNCHYCDKKYRTPKELQHHEKWHSDNKPFVCSQCGKSYKSKNHLKNHMRYHTGERPFECTLCSSSFMTSSILKRHKMIHSGEKPHICHNCGKAFIEKSNLRNHMKIHKTLLM